MKNPKLLMAIGAAVVVLGTTAAVVVLGGLDKVKTSLGIEDKTFKKEMPDLGGVKVVEVEGKGIGPTRNAAILDALNMVLKQTNGTPIAGVTVNSTGSVSTPEGTRDSGFTNETVAAISGGWIQSFEILSETEMTNAKRWEVTLRAKINKYEASADTKLPKVAIAHPRTFMQQYVVGDQTLSADEAARMIQKIVGDTIQKSKRFFVINRSFDNDINEELSQINGYSANPSEWAKLGQRLTADILILPEITHLEYQKSTRNLRFSGRELNSYAGGVDVNFSVVNVVTGQLIMTERFSAVFPSTPPSVYGRQNVGVENVHQYLAMMTEQFTRQFILKNFPVSVIKMDGASVVLNQGQDMLKVGDVYNAVSLGEAIQDPQTGQSLGRLESPVGTIRIVKTTEKISIGAYSGKFRKTDFQPGIIELRELIQTPKLPTESTPAQAPTTEKAAQDEFDSPFDD